MPDHKHFFRLTGPRYMFIDDHAAYMFKCACGQLCIIIVNEWGLTKQTNTKE